MATSLLERTDPALNERQRTRRQDRRTAASLAALLSTMAVPVAGGIAKLLTARPDGWPLAAAVCAMLLAGLIVMIVYVLSVRLD